MRKNRHIVLAYYIVSMNETSAGCDDRKIRKRKVRRKKLNRGTPGDDSGGRIYSIIP